MISFFKDIKKNQTSSEVSLSKIASLLIHVAKIDQNYTEKEEEIIKKTLIELGANKLNINELISNAAIMEDNSNQILDFTKEIKEMAEKDKIKIIESLWKIIYSNDISDMYESNLMRRLAGLLYIDAKTMGYLKEKAKEELIK